MLNQINTVYLCQAVIVSTVLLDDAKLQIPLHFLCECAFLTLATLVLCLGCKLLFYPGAFNMTTGPAHWEPLIRARYCRTFTKAFDFQSKEN